MTRRVTKSWGCTCIYARETENKDLRPAAAAALEGWGSGELQLLLDFNAFDAQVPVEVEEGVFLCAHPVGEVDDRAVGQLHQELCGGEFDDHLERKEEAEGSVKDPKKGGTIYTVLGSFSRFGAHLKLLALLERKASLPHLLTPVAPQVGVADHLVLIPVRVEAGV